MAPRTREGASRRPARSVVTRCLTAVTLCVLGCGGSGGSGTGPGPMSGGSPTIGLWTPALPTPVPIPTATASSELAPGELDPSFGDGGRAVVPFSGTAAVFRRGLLVRTAPGSR